MKLSWRGLRVLFFTSTLLEQIGRGHLTAFTPLLLHDLGLSGPDVGVWTGVLFTITMGVGFPLTPFWGALAERYSGRLVIVRSYYLEAAAYLLCFLASDIHWLIGARVLLGLTFGNMATVMATQSAATPRKHLGSAIATVQTAQPIGASIGPPIGALLLPLIGLRGLFLLDTIMTIVGGLLVTFLLADSATERKRVPIFARAKGVMGQVWREPPLRWNFVAALSSRGASSTVETYLPVRITQLALSDSAQAIGVILGVYGALTAVATWLVGRLLNRVDESWLFFRAMVLATLLTVGLALAPNVWVLGVLAALLSIPVAMSATVLFSHLARVLPRSQQTVVMALVPLPRTTGALVFPMLAAAVIPLWAGAALAVGALSYAIATYSGQRMATVTTKASHASAEPEEA